MQNDREVFWQVFLDDGRVEEFDNAEAARKTAKLYAAAYHVVPRIFKIDPVKGPIEIQP